MGVVQKWMDVTNKVTVLLFHTGDVSCNADLVSRSSMLITGRTHFQDLKTHFKFRNAFQIGHTFQHIHFRLKNMHFRFENALFQA